MATLLSSCAKLRDVDWGKPAIEPDGRKRAQQNVKDGKGIQIFKSGQTSGSNFLFASSNALWRASLDTLNFISIANTDYSGGILITDWYSEENSNESIKITIRFLSNEVRADGLIVQIFKRNCVNNSCSTKEIKTELVFEIKDKILRTAAVYEKEDRASAKESRPKKVYKGDNE